ncbi:MAG: archease [Candidatus Omnitrophica bacterium]|nr:archease [Candidatus Omnitrophota bacterium]
MKDKTYEILEHTADIAVRIKAQDLKELFKNAGLAIFQISSRKQFAKNKSHIDLSIKLKADDLEQLFINWLNELLSLSATHNLVFYNIKINKLGGNNLEAIAIGNDMGNYKVYTEIKAATYHQLKIEETKEGWSAEVIFDV